MDFGLKEFGFQGTENQLARYRRYVYEKVGIVSEQKLAATENKEQKVRSKN